MHRFSRWTIATILHRYFVWQRASLQLPFALLHHHPSSAAPKVEIQVLVVLSGFDFPTTTLFVEPFFVPVPLLLVRHRVEWREWRKQQGEHHLFREVAGCIQR